MIGACAHLPQGVGDLVYLGRGGAADEVDSGVQRHKLQSKALGPYPVVRACSHTVEIDRDGLREVVSRDRIALAPPAPVLGTNSPREEGPETEAPEYMGCLEPREAEPEEEKAGKTQTWPKRPTETISSYSTGSSRRRGVPALQGAVDGRHSVGGYVGAGISPAEESVLRFFNREKEEVPPNLLAQCM